MSNVSLADVRAAIESGNEQIANLKNQVDERLISLEARYNKLELFEGFGGAHGGGVTGKLIVPGREEIKSMRIAEDGSGGVLVADDAAGPFFEALGARAVVLAAGPITVDMTSDAKPLPRELPSDDEPSPVGEGGEIAEMDMPLGVSWLRARKYPIRTRSSNELLDDSNPSARELVASWHVRKLARRLDKDMLQGNGNAIVGIRRTAGIGGDELGSGNGAAIELDDILDSLGRLEDADVDMTRVALFMSGRTWKTLRKEKDAVGGRYQVQPNVSEEARKVLFGRPVFTSSQISVNETVGGSTDCSWVAAVDMSRIAVGIRKSYTVLYDPFTRSKFDETVVQTITRVAFSVVDPTAVDLITGVRA